MTLLFTMIMLLFAGQSRAEAQGISRADTLLAAKKHFSFAVQYKKNGDYTDALRQYEKSIALNDTVFQVHFSFAELLMLMNLQERAKAEYLRTLALNPEHYASASLLAGMYYHAALYDSALVMYETMHRIKQEPSTLTGIARLREYLGKKREALDALRMLIDQGELSKENLTGAAKLALAEGDTGQALGYAVRALEIDPQERGMLRFAAQISRAKDEREQEAGYLRRLALVDSTGTGILRELATASRASGDRITIIWALERLYRLDPSDSETLGELAENLLADGETARAEQLVKRGLETSPKDGRLHIILGEIHRGRGEAGRAAAEYRIALSDPRWEESARHFLQRLEHPETATEKKEREFFGRGKKSGKTDR